MILSVSYLAEIIAQHGLSLCIVEYLELGARGVVADVGMDHILLENDVIAWRVTVDEFTAAHLHPSGLGVNQRARFVPGIDAVDMAVVERHATLPFD